MTCASLVAFVSILAAPVWADVTVRTAPGAVDLIARTAPLSAVLELLARHTGMKVVYDGPPPGQLVTVSLSRPSLREVVCGLLEGQGLDYGLAGNMTVVRILVLTTKVTAPASRPANAESSLDRSPAPVEDGEAEIPTALKPLRPEQAEPTGEGIPAPLRGLMPERDRGATGR